MTKDEAITLLGGTVKLAAENIGVRPQAIYAWKSELSKRTEARVLAFLWQQSVSGKRRARKPAKA